MIQNLINHVALVIDKSSSMSAIANKTVEVFDKEINYLKTRSQELNQETRISVYLFNEKVECLVFDMDVMRMSSLKTHYTISGMTALIDGCVKAFEDMQKLPELYGDHAFLIYAITDGEENSSKSKAGGLQRLIQYAKDNWTVVCLVPNGQGIHEAKKFGFPQNNIQVWDTTSKGVENVGKEFRSAMDGYMTMRSQGIRGTKNYFTTDLSNITTTEVKNTCQKLNANDYYVLPIHTKQQIKPTIESWLKKPYVLGSAYYELMKTETIQSYKEMVIQDRKTGQVYSGNVRSMLNLPNVETKVSPGDHGNWRIFVQSTSVNRNLIPGTQVFVYA